MVRSKASTYFNRLVNEDLRELTDLSWAECGVLRATYERRGCMCECEVSTDHDSPLRKEVSQSATDNECVRYVYLLPVLIG